MNIEMEHHCSLLSPSSLDMGQETRYRVTSKEARAKVTAGRD